MSTITPKEQDLLPGFILDAPRRCCKMTWCFCPLGKFRCDLSHAKTYLPIFCHLICHQQNMSLFLRILPADLHKDILYVWLNDRYSGACLIRVLSSLDIACPRRLGRSLISGLPPFGESYDPWKSNIAGRNMLRFMRWLDSRKVPLRTLMLTGIDDGVLEVLDREPFPDLHLPSVDTIYWSGSYSIFSVGLGAAVLRYCPNLTAVDNQFSVNFPECSHVGSPKMELLTISGPYRAALSLPQLCGPQLRELRMRNCGLKELDAVLEVIGQSNEVVESIGRACPLLEVFETKLSQDKFPLFLRLLQLLKHLREVILEVDKLNHAHCTEICEMANIKRFTAISYSPNKHAVIFATLLEQRPDLEYLNICGYAYDSLEGILEMAAGFMNVAFLEGLLNRCTDVRELRIKTFTGWTRDAVELIGDKLAGRLSSLTIGGGHSFSLELMLTSCGPSLRYLELSGGEISDRTFQLVSKSCQNLESLSLRLDYNSISDVGMISVISGCSKLKELSSSIAQDLTVASLQAILDHKLRLTRLELSSRNIGAADTAWFREQVKLLQLLPFPAIVLLG